MSTITKEQAQKIIEAADEVITALAGTNEDVHPESDSMLRLWDDLNDRYAPPEVVRELACIALASLEADKECKHHSVIAEQLAHVLSNMDATDHQRAVISCAVDRLNKVSQLLQSSPSALLVPEALDYQGAKELYNYLMNEEETNATVNGWNACRAAMLQGAESVTTAYKLPANTPCKDAPEHIWLQTSGIWTENAEFSELTWCSDNQHPDDTLYVRADVVSGNSPVIPDGWVLVPIEPTYQMCEAMGLPWESPRFPDRYKAMIEAINISKK